MSIRITGLTSEQRSSAQQGLYDTLVEGPRGQNIVMPDGSLFGPFEVMLRSPEVGDQMQALGLAIQGAGGLPVDVREAAILRVVAERKCGPEWIVHSQRGAQAGLTPAEIAAIAAGLDLADSRADIREAVALAEILLSHSEVGSDDYRRALAALGEKGVFDVCALVGYYDSLTSLFRVFALDQDA